MPRFLVVSCCLACLAWGAACGDDDGGEVTVSTGLPRNDALSSLNDEDAVQACVSTARSFNDVLSDSELERISCVIVGLSVVIDQGTEGGASAIAECKEITNDCLNGEIDGMEIGEIDVTLVEEESCGGARASATFAGCDATVGDYEDCAGEVKGQLRDQLTAISCDGLKDPDTAMDQLEPEIDVADAPRCEALRDECPEVDFSG